jgi:glycosyltransferase involved in cell wall biosynthesis
VRNMRLPWWRSDVRFLGFVDESRMRALMAGATAFVLPSAYESFSIVTLEAMAQRTPVLLNEECTVLAEHVRRSGSGFTFLGVEDLDHAIERVLDLPPEERKRLGEAGRRYVIENFSRDRIAQGLITYVNGVTGN